MLSFSSNVSAGLEYTTVWQKKKREALQQIVHEQIYQWFKPDDKLQNIQFSPESDAVPISYSLLCNIFP